ncbi:MAG: hypothetical protein R6V03_06515 [Kiritimatiellia bacterium]
MKFLKTADEITRSIDRTTRFKPAWTIGISADVRRSRKEHGQPRFWYEWEAASEAEAEAVKTHFTERRMKESGSHQGRYPRYVFIFLR